MGAGEIGAVIALRGRGRGFFIGAMTAAVGVQAVREWAERDGGGGRCVGNGEGDM